MDSPEISAFGYPDSKEVHLRDGKVVHAGSETRSTASRENNGDHGSDQLERCGRWLASIPRDDITELRRTNEFREFLCAFERLGRAHLRVIINNDNLDSKVSESDFRQALTATTSSSATKADILSPSRGRSSDAIDEKSAIPNLGASGKVSDGDANSSLKASVRDKDKIQFADNTFGSNESLRRTFVESRHNQRCDSMVSGFAGPSLVGDTKDTTRMVTAEYEECGHADKRKGQSQTRPAFANSSDNGCGESGGKICINNQILRLTEDLLLRILEFLRCRCLIQTSFTCSRFYHLAQKSAIQRTYDITHTRQLGNIMQLLRAKEQIHCIDDDSNTTHSYERRREEHEINDTSRNDPVGGMPTASLKNLSYQGPSFHVPVPTLLPGRRVLVTNAGDPEFNGIYYCTESNGNGFVFTKPRFSSRQHQLEVASQTHSSLETLGLRDMDVDEGENMDARFGHDDRQQQHQRQQQQQEQQQQDHDVVAAVQVPDQQPIIASNNERNNRNRDPFGVQHQPRRGLFEGGAQ